MPKINTHPIGENSPNLVTLLSVEKLFYFIGVMISALGTQKSNVGSHWLRIQLMFTLQGL
jgi:hypothetical protein